MPSKIADLFLELEDRLFRYRCMRVGANPILVGLRTNLLSYEKTASILGQYSVLPARIASYLALGARRLACWPDVEKELQRNLGEELGSETGGIPHYQIFCNTLRDEVHLEVLGIRPWPSTRRFLDDLRGALESRPPAFTAGVLFALEASAVPELTIVAAIINEYSECTNGSQLIDLVPPHGRIRHDFSTGPISLNDFFVMHVHDFEIDHRDFLAKAIEPYLTTAAERAMFVEGFDHLMGGMEWWWEALATPMMTDECTAPAGKSPLVQ
jgi:Domain of Unknown Function with PDB structure (DUF3865)